MGEIVFQQNKEVLTSSLIVAKVFGKQHKDVLRSIAKLNESLGVLNRTAQKCALLHEKSNDVFYSQLMEGVDLSNIQYHKSSYIGEQNKEHDMYLMDKDSFILLAMGFSGVKALRFKLAFIGAFNKMQKELARINQENAKDLKAQLSRANFLLTRGSNQLEQRLSYNSNESVTMSDITCYVGICEAYLYEVFAYLGIVLMVDGVWHVNDRLGVGSMVKETFTDHFGIKRSNTHILWNPYHKNDILALSYAINGVLRLIKEGRRGYSEEELYDSFDLYIKYDRKIPVNSTQIKQIYRLLAEQIYK